MSDHNAEFQSQQQRRHIRRRAREIETVDFFNLLTGPELLETTELTLPEHRERLGGAAWAAFHRLPNMMLFIWRARLEKKCSVFLLRSSIPGDATGSSG